MCSSFFLFFIIIIGDLLMFFTLHPKCSASWFCLSFGLNFALYTDMQLADVVAVYEKNLRKKNINWNSKCASSEWYTYGQVKTVKMPSSHTYMIVFKRK
jgi:hypothetical protein